MRLIKSQPFREIDQLFSSPYLTKVGEDLAIDLYEEEGNIVAKLNLPGIKPEEVELMLEDDTFNIIGNREEEKEVDEKDYYTKEILRGSFSRTVSLPKYIEPAKSYATYGDGVLTLTMPLAPDAEEKGVHIKVQSQ